MGRLASREALHHHAKDPGEEHRRRANARAANPSVEHAWIARHAPALRRCKGQVRLQHVPHGSYCVLFRFPPGQSLYPEASKFHLYRSIEATLKFRLCL